MSIDPEVAEVDRAVMLRSHRCACPLCGSFEPRADESSRLCRGCAEPTLVSCTGSRSEFRVGSGQTLVVGTNVVELDGRPVNGFVSISPPLAATLAEVGLRFDAGVRFDGFGVKRPSRSLAPQEDLRFVIGVGAGTGVVHRAALRAIGAMSARSADPDPDVASLVDRLRKMLPVPTADLVVRRVGTIDVLSVSGDRPTITCHDRDDDGSVVVSECELDWVPVNDASATIYEAAEGRFTARLERVNRSHLLTLSSPRESLVLFIPNSDGITLESELTLQRFGQSVGAPASSVLMTAIAAACPPPVQNPNATLVGRQFNHRVSVVDRPSITPLTLADIANSSQSQRPTGDGLTAEFPSSDVPSADDVSSSNSPTIDVSTAETRPELRAWAAEMDPAPPTVTIGRLFDVQELWRGDGELVHRYAVVGGDAPVGPLGDSASFVVDRSGHAVPVEKPPCEVCGLTSCDECPPVVGIGDCRRCGQSACGMCRRSGRGLPLFGVDATKRCRICDAELCTACGRSQLAQRCSVCDELVCGGCVTDEDSPRCRACVALESASDSLVMQLPRELRMIGTTPRVGRAGHSTVVVLEHGLRREIAVLAGDGLSGSDVVSWRVFGAPHPLAWAVAVAVGEQLSGRAVRVVEHIDTTWAADEAEQPSLDLSVARHSVVRVLGPEGQVLHPGVRHLVALDGTQSVEEALLDTLGVDHPGLEFTDDEWPLDVGPRGIAVVVLLDRLEHLDRVSLMGDGLRRDHGAADRPMSEVAPWVECDPEDARDDGLSFMFDSVRVSELGQWRVRIVELGPLAWAEVVGPDFAGPDCAGPDVVGDWWRVAGAGLSVDSVLLADRLLGGTQLVEVVGLAGAGTFAPIELVNATLVHRQIVQRTVELDRDFVAPEPVARESIAPDSVVPTACDASSGRAHESLARVVPTVGFEMDAVGFPEVIARAPVAPWAHLVCGGLANDGELASARAVAVRVDAHVMEKWSIDSRLIEIEYDVEGGVAAAEAKSYDTGALVREFTIDRNNHLVSDPRSCCYCDTVTCRECPDPVMPCVVCAMQRCGSCGVVRDAMALCIACAGLERESKRRPLGGTRLHGEDRLHTVEIRLRNNGPADEVHEGAADERRHVVDPAVRAALRRWIAPPRE